MFIYSWSSGEQQEEQGKKKRVSKAVEELVLNALYFVGSAGNDNVRIQRLA